MLARNGNKENIAKLFYDKLFSQIFYENPTNMQNLTKEQKRFFSVRRPNNYNYKSISFASFCSIFRNSNFC